ncbi:MAG: HlyC/CorC family transporter [Phycisphaerales bacterium]|nr:hemolysin family protein [Phycisphaerae bacterium]NNF44870.1 HlyC/CorC family transporter [Phycisphaerales bacterium]NNM24934.1 HlyC/CorC family transporter [Phycisphaerales bacterium]
MNAVILAVVVVLATYVSALVLSLMQVRRAAVERRLANREAAAAWLFDHASSIQLAVSLLRTILRLAVFALVLIEIAGVGESANLTYESLAIAGVVTVLVLWVATTVLASALARHAGAGLVAGALPLLRLVDLVCLPLTKALSFVDEAVRRLTGANLREADEAAEEELLRSIDETQREGGLDERSAEMLENVVEFSTTDVDEVMTPRTDIDGIELTDDLAAIRTFIVKVGHSRIPVYQDDLDHIVGVLYVKDLVPYLGEDASDFKLEPLLRQPIVVPETKQVRELLGEFQRSEVHMAIVIDEYGGTAGLVTIEDVLEEIVGEIHDEHDPDDEEPPALIRLDETRLEVDGRFHIDDLNTELGLALPEDGEFDTVAGFVLASLGRVPEVGDSFELGSARFTTLAATPTHVQRVGIELLIGERQDA